MGSTSSHSVRDSSVEPCRTEEGASDTQRGWTCFHLANTVRNSDLAQKPLSWQVPRGCVTVNEGVPTGESHGGPRTAKLQPWQGDQGQSRMQCPEVSEAWGHVTGWLLGTGP